MQATTAIGGINQFIAVCYFTCFSLYCIVLRNVVTPTRKSLEFKHASQ